MISKELIDRINYLAKKQKEGTLTQEEKQEQANLRQEYIRAFRQRLQHTLEGIEYAEDKDNPKH